jgi:hypothetical protein
MCDYGWEEQSQRNRKRAIIPRQFVSSGIIELGISMTDVLVHQRCFVLVQGRVPRVVGLPAPSAGQFSLRVVYIADFGPGCLGR